MDRHSMLGLDPGAASHEIKRAFRRLAMRWHPDRNPDPGAAEHFKRLRAAYESLLEELETHAAPDAGEAGSASEESAPGGPGPDAPPRGPDRRQDLVLDLEEAFLGCEKHVAIEREAGCDACGGTGTEALTHTRLCEACHGSGRLRGKSGLIRCGTCDGRGFLTRQPCGACGGAGRRIVERTVSVKVPAGIQRGDELRLAGEGEPAGEPGGEPGDLRLRVVIAPHPLYTQAGRDLFLTRPVSALRLLAGGTLRVPLPGGGRTLRLAPGAAEPREVRVAGAGFPGKRGEPPGDLVVQLEPVFPTGLNEAARKLIARLEAELARDSARHWPGLAEWEAQWLEDD